MPIDRKRKLDSIRFPCPNSWQLLNYNTINDLVHLINNSGTIHSCTRTWLFIDEFWSSFCDNCGGLIFGRALFQRRFFSLSLGIDFLVRHKIGGEKKHWIQNICTTTSRNKIFALVSTDAIGGDNPQFSFINSIAFFLFRFSQFHTVGTKFIEKRPGNKNLKSSFKPSIKFWRRIAIASRTELPETALNPINYLSITNHYQICI